MNYPPYQPQPMQPRPNAPGAVPSIVLGILGLVLCVICAPFAIAQGNQAKRAIQQSPGAYGGEGMAQAGVILGWIGVALFGLGLIFLVLVFVIGAGFYSS